MRSKLLYSFLVFTVCLGCVNIASAEDINASVETTFMSKYMWHGFEWYGNKTGTNVDFKVNLGESGFYFGSEYMTPNGSGNVNVNSFDNYPYDSRFDGSLVDRAKFIYYAGYKFNLFEVETFNTALDFTYKYHDYYRISSETLDQQEFNLLAEWPDLIGGGFVPYYQATYLSDGDGERGLYDSVPDTMPPFASVYGEDQNAHIKGWLHKIGIAYDMPLNIPELGMYDLRLMVDTVYNDGAWESGKASRNMGGASMGGGSEWTHVTYGAETGMDLGFGNIGLGVYYQHAMADDYTNLNNTFYSTISYKMEF
jgi:hypothetical protein